MGASHVMHAAATPAEQNSHLLQFIFFIFSFCPLSVVYLTEGRKRFFFRQKNLFKKNTYCSIFVIILKTFFGKTMTFPPSLPSSEDCQEFVKLFSESISLDHSARWGEETYQIKSPVAFEILKEKFLWFDLRKIYRLYHHNECDCLCSKKPCICFNYQYRLPDEWSIKVDEIRE
jgi:hypothetical protein